MMNNAYGLEAMMQDERGLLSLTKAMVTPDIDVRTRIIELLAGACMVEPVGHGYD